MPDERIVMRITIVLGPFHPPPPAPSGAVEKAWWLIAKEFVQRGNEVTIVGSDHPDLPRSEAWEGVRFLRRPPLHRSGSTIIDILRDAPWSAAAAKVLPDADVTVTNCFWLPWLIGRRRGASRDRLGVLNVHVQRYPKGQMRLYRAADRLSTVSQAIADAIATECPSLAGRTLVIPNPIDLGTFRPGSARPDRPALLLYTGRLHPAKRLDLLVLAWRTLRDRGLDIRLRMVGPWETKAGGGGERLLDTLRRLGSPHRFETPGPIADPTDLAEEMRLADLYCYPSTDARGEALPVAPLEAMACGLAPIVSDLRQYAGILTHERTAMVFPSDRGDAVAVEAIISILIRLIEDHALRDGLRRNAIEAAERLSPAAIAERHLDDFRRCLEEKQRDTP